MPKVPPEPDWKLEGWARLAVGPVYGRSRFGEKFARPPPCVPMISGVLFPNAWSRIGFTKIDGLLGNASVAAARGACTGCAATG